MRAEEVSGLEQQPFMVLRVSLYLYFKGLDKYLITRIMTADMLCLGSIGLARLESIKSLVS